MLSNRFASFKERYYKIINELENTKHEKLKKFILSKSDYPFDLNPQDFNFYFDSHKQKLIFSITNGMHNAVASNILHYFRTLDNKAIWCLHSTDKNTIRTFELDLEKVGDKLLDDFEAFIKLKGKQENTIEVATK